MEDKIDTDILIAGGGYVGLSLALSIKQAAPALQVILVDRGRPEGAGPDERASAITFAARKMLSQLGIWEKMEADAQPITNMVVTDSALFDVYRPIFLTFSGMVAGDEPFAHMVPNQIMISALQKAVSDAGVQLISGQSVDRFETSTICTKAQLTGDGQITARILIAADGARSRLRDWAGVSTVGWTYDQIGLVTNVTHERPHEGQAVEHFLPAGPFAILPLTGNRSSLVWTEEPALARSLLNEDPLIFSVELERRFGHVLGAVERASAIQSFPLGLQIARDMVKNRFALVGDAAHAIHPIAGQGLNLGFKDAAALAEVIIDAWRLGDDFGQEHILERYQRWRRFDTAQMGMVTDGLNRLFSNNIEPLKIIRDLGLGIVERLPGLKTKFIEQAAGLTQSGPRLLRGEKL